MEPRRLDWTDGLCVGALLSIAFVALVYVPLGWAGIYKLLRSPTAISWAHVFATLIGIAAAAGGLIWQVRRSAQQTVDRIKESEIQRLQMLSGVIASLFFHITFYRWESEKGVLSEDDRMAIARQNQQLDRLNLWELPDWEAWHGAELALHAATILLNRLEEVNSAFPTMPGLHHRREPHLNVAEINVVAAMDGLTSALGRRHAKHIPISYELNKRKVSLTADGELVAK